MGNLGPGVFSLLVANKRLLTACGTPFLFCSVFAFSVWFCFAKGIWCSLLTPYALGSMSYFLFCSLPFYPFIFYPFIFVYPKHKEGELHGFP